MQMSRAAPNAERIDLMFRAFSDRTRLRILSILRGGECCVGDLVIVLGVEQPSASRHLAYLRRAGLVTVRRAGLWKYYSLAPAGGTAHAKLLECLACCFQDVPQLRQDRARAGRLRKAGGCCPGTAAADEAKMAGGTRTPGRCCAAPGK
jgi:ArsR family transcriptional regulator